MQPITSTMATLLTLLLTTTYTTASSFQVNNYCNASLWATISSPSAPYPAAFEIPSGVANAYDIVGKGNSLGVTFSQDYYAQDTPKLVLGFTTDAGRLWWSLGTIFQNPFQNLTFNVTSPDNKGENKCGDAVGVDGVSHNCEEGNFTLTFNPCFE